jgi:hypothetical protein
MVGCVVIFRAASRSCRVIRRRFPRRQDGYFGRLWIVILRRSVVFIVINHVMATAFAAPVGSLVVFRVNAIAPTGTSLRIAVYARARELSPIGCLLSRALHRTVGWFIFHASFHSICPPSLRPLANSSHCPIVQSAIYHVAKSSKASTGQMGERLTGRSVVRSCRGCCGGSC